MLHLKHHSSRNYKNIKCYLSTSNVPKVQNFINGKFEDSRTSEWIPLYNPANQDLLCMVPQSTPEELQRAEDGAIEAFKTWKEVPVQQKQVSITIIHILYIRYMCIYIILIIQTNDDLIIISFVKLYHNYMILI